MMGKTRRKRNEFERYRYYATMCGRDGWHYVTVTVPVGLPEFHELKSKGFRIIDRWKRSK